ncbi:DUF5655 domain-containing protein [Patescibacteria group bacterium]
MWTCVTCGRIFKNTNQPHSCKKIPLEKHFKNKEKAKELFGFLVKQINKQVGKCKIISIPCCIHLFGTYDFLAALPKKDGLEIRFALGRKLKSPRLNQSVSLSQKVFKNCFNICAKKEIDKEFIGWLNESYHLKD